MLAYYSMSLLSMLKFVEFEQCTRYAGSDLSLPVLNFPALIPYELRKVYELKIFGR